MSSATLLGGRPEASFKETLRSMRIMKSNPLCKKTLERHGCRERGVPCHILLGFFLGSLCLGTSCLYFVISALRPFGRWARAMGTGRFECAPEKLLAAQRQFACVWSNLLSSLFFRILDPDVFSGLRRFFRNPAENFAGLRSGTFFRPKEDPGIYIYVRVQLFNTWMVWVWFQLVSGGRYSRRGSDAFNPRGSPS